MHAHSAHIIIYCAARVVYTALRRNTHKRPKRGGGTIYGLGNVLGTRVLLLRIPPPPHTILLCQTIAPLLPQPLVHDRIQRPHKILEYIQNGGCGLARAHICPSPPYRYLVARQSLEFTHHPPPPARI